ncbi:hypothetical protein B566_EDAN002068 [Ephemera danica]|nr:hypothetical protein B566_EDAN002068 [Ephemera danica]
MWFLYLLSWIAMLVQICFLTIAVAAGLYYLAELVEEYTVITKKIVWWLCVVVLCIYIGFFLFEDFPTSIIVCGLISQVAHLCILQTFPYFVVLSPSFITAVVMLIVNHYMAFQFFSTVYFSFSEVLSYFTLCLWVVPFALFVSLSANENTLPTVEARHGKKYGLLTFFNYAKDSILPQRSKKAF